MSDKHENAHGEESHGKSHGGGHGGGGHGGGGHAEGEHEGAPEWLISFADMVMLIMGFFVILLAMNMQKPTQGGIGGEGKNVTDDDRMLELALAIRAGFNNPLDMNSDNPADAHLIRQVKAQMERGATADPSPDGDKHDVQTVRPSDFVNDGAVVAFTEGESTLTADAKTTIVQAAERIRGTRWIIEVRGHASASETMRDKEKSMRLAFDRSLAVAQELVRNNVEWDRLRVSGAADNERLVPVARGGAHRSNQRVEIVTTNESMAPDPYGVGAEQR